MSHEEARKFLKYGRHVKSEGKPATYSEHMKAKHSALKTRTSKSWHDKRVEHMSKDPAMEKDSQQHQRTTGAIIKRLRDLPR